MNKHHTSKARGSAGRWGWFVAGVVAACLTACSGEGDASYSEASSSTSGEDADAWVVLARGFVDTLNWGSGTSGTDEFDTLETAFVQAQPTPKLVQVTFTANQAGTVSFPVFATVLPLGNLYAMHYLLEDADHVLAQARVRITESDQLALSFDFNTGVAPGVSRHTLKLHMCRDEACQHPYLGSPMVLPVVLTVR